MNYLLALVPIVAAAVGGMAVVYGGYDDSPGGQLLGAAFVAVGAILAVRNVRRRTT